VQRALLRFAVFAVVVLAAIPAATAQAAQQMPVGFFDDISFRFAPDHPANLASAAATASA